MKSNLTIDQFATREIPPAAARELAHRALEDPELFDALVARGAVEASLDARAVQVALSVPTRRRQWTIALCAVAAAWLLAVFVWRSVVSRQSHQPAQQAVAIVPKPAILPSLNVRDQAGRPILMASELSPARAAAAVFRGDSAANRVPQSSGMITALADGEATVNLGSLDGLAKGTELGPIVITTVFRDHARGRVVNASAVHVNDRVSVSPAIHLSAVQHQVDALAASGDLDGARALARTTLAVGSSGETRALLERLAALDYQAGATDAAREHYEAAANNFYAPPAASASEQAVTLNSLGALYLLRGDPQSAAKPLNQAASQSDIDPDLHAQILNNLGVMLEMKGDLAAARDDYSRSHAEHLGNISQANLTRLTNLKHP
jgi:tetratricopeptide (TPR) repeat protein